MRREFVSIIVFAFAGFLFSSSITLIERSVKHVSQSTISTPTSTQVALR